MTPNCVCEHCSKPFYAKPSYIAAGRGRFCSKECFGHAKTAKGRIPATCLTCSKPFMARKSAIDAGVGRFCSHPCAVRHRVDAIPRRECAICHKPVMGRGRLCSQECVSEERSRKARTEVHCRTCQKPFLAFKTAIAAGQAKFCGLSCSMVARNTDPTYSITGQCEHCGKDAALRPALHARYGKRVFCDGDCYRARMQAEAPKHTCLTCGTEFTIPHRSQGKAIGKFCSRGCAARSPTLVRKPPAPRPLTARRPRPCRHCGTMFIPTGDKRAATCSPECLHARKNPSKSLDAHRDLILAKRKAGSSWERISKLVGVAEVTIVGWAKANGIQTGRTETSEMWPAQILELGRGMAASGLSGSQIAAVLSKREDFRVVTKGAVVSAFKKAGIPLTRRNGADPASARKTLTPWQRWWRGLKPKERNVISTMPHAPDCQRGNVGPLWDCTCGVSQPGVERSLRADMPRAGAQKAVQAVSDSGVGRITPRRYTPTRGLYVPKDGQCSYVTSDGPPWDRCGQPLFRRSYCRSHWLVCYQVSPEKAAA